VIAPLSTLTHWQREFQSWTNLNTIVYHGTSEDRKLIREHEFAYQLDRPDRHVGINQLYLKKCGQKKPTRVDNPWMVDVVITTPEIMIADDSVELTAVEWEVLVVSILPPPDLMVL
jgi:chromodomain-helicase-DNA-binding protein 7